LKGGKVNKKYLKRGIEKIISKIIEEVLL